MTLLAGTPQRGRERNGEVERKKGRKKERKNNRCRSRVGSKKKKSKGVKVKEKKIKMLIFFYLTVESFCPQEVMSVITALLLLKHNV